MSIQGSDLILVERGATLYKESVSNLPPSGTAAYGVHALGPGIAVNRFASLQINAGALNVIASAANRLDLMPFIPARSFTTNQLSLEVSTAGAAGTLGRLGIYASDANGEPSGLLVQGNTTIDTASVGDKVTAIAAMALTAGTIYWLAVLSSGGPTYRGVPVASVIALAGDAVATGNYSIRRATFAFASLPTPAPATVLTSAIVPHIRLRRSA